MNENLQKYNFYIKWIIINYICKICSDLHQTTIARNDGSILDVTTDYIIHYNIDNNDCDNIKIS